MDRDEQYKNITNEVNDEHASNEIDFQQDDVSSLPSRAEIHRQKRKEKQWKPKYPLIKLLALFFVLLPVVLYSWFTFFGGSDNLTGKKASGNNDGYETIGINNNNDKNTTLNIRDIDDVGDENNDIKNEGEDNSSKQQPVTENTNEGKTADSNTDIPKEQKNEQEELNNNKTEAEPLNQNSKDTVYHTVKANETLYRISMNYFESQTGVDIIKQANNLQSDEIYVGQVLKIPLNN